ncbi:MAG TPA: urease accessory protein UreD [Acidocella sp.]|nr:urease accessory protein UreD [Acidocella sp.]
MTLPCQLDLSFAPGSRGRTILAERRASYPYSITAPIVQADGTARLTLQSISGGLYGGETLSQHIRLGAGASARLVQPAATTVRRRAQAGPARQSIRLEVGAGARLIYATRPLIMLPGSALRQDWEVSLAPGALVILWDGFVSHSPKGEAPDWMLASRLTARTAEGRLLAAERMVVQGAALGSGFQGASGAFSAFGKFWCLGATAGITPAETVLRGLDNIRTGSTALPGHAGFTIALAASDGGALSAAMDQILARLDAPSSR